MYTNLNLLPGDYSDITRLCLDLQNWPELLQSYDTEKTKEL